MSDGPSHLMSRQSVDVLRLSPGPAWPADVPWPPGEHTLVLTGPSRSEACPSSDVALSGTSIHDGGVSVLATCKNGQFGLAFDFDAWQQTMMSESYRSEHTMPLTARLPFHYHRLPGVLRNVLAATVLRLNRTCAFPAGLRDCGSLLTYALVANGAKNSEPPTAVLTHDIDTLYGFDWIEAIAAAEEAVGARACWNIVPRHYPIDDGKLGRLATAGHEIGLHGIWHTNREAFLLAPQLAHEFEKLHEFRTRFSIQTYRGPSWYRTQHMFDVVAEYFNVDLSTLDIDFLCARGGGVGVARAFRIRPTLIEIPCTLPFEAPIFFDLPRKALSNFWQPKIDLLKRAGGMAVVNTHPDPNYLGNSKMLAEYRALLAHLAETGWTFKLPREIVVG